MKWKMSNPKTVTLQKYRFAFETMDGVKHQSKETDWIIIERFLNNSALSYLKREFLDENYMESEDEIIYPFSNIKYIMFVKTKEIKVDDIFSKFHVCVTDKELEEAFKIH